MPAPKQFITWSAACAAPGFVVIIVTGTHLEPLGWCLFGMSVGVATFGLIFG